MPLLRSLIFLAVLAPLVVEAAAACSSNCNGRGYCNHNGSCVCYDVIENGVRQPGWTGDACELRQCPTGLVRSRGQAAACGLQGVECSAAGECNRETGACACNATFLGEACERSDCPLDCSGHGHCEAQSSEDSSILLSKYRCVCDLGFIGADCAMMRCPRGGPENKECGGFDRGLCEFRRTGACYCFDAFAGGACNSLLPLLGEAWANGSNSTRSAAAAPPAFGWLRGASMPCPAPPERPASSSAAAGKNGSDDGANASGVSGALTLPERTIRLLAPACAAVAVNASAPSLDKYGLVLVDVALSATFASDAERCVAALRAADVATWNVAQRRAAAELNVTAPTILAHAWCVGLNCTRHWPEQLGLGVPRGSQPATFAPTATPTFSPSSELAEASADVSSTTKSPPTSTRTPPNSVATSSAVARRSVGLCAAAVAALVAGAALAGMQLGMYLPGA